jgi:hypothetical protein
MSAGSATAWCTCATAPRPEQTAATVADQELIVALERLWGRAKPRHLEPQPRGGRVLAGLVRPQRLRHAGAAGRTPSRGRRRDQGAAPPGDRAAAHLQGGATQWVYWSSGTAHLLPRLLRLPDGSTRTSGPLFLSHRRPGPTRRPAATDLCPHTGRARLGYDRARILLDRATSPGGGRPGWDLHQLRHSAATHLGEAGVALRLIMAKTRHRNPRTAMRYVNPGAEAVAKVTQLLDITPPRRG